MWRTSFHELRSPLQADSVIQRHVVVAAQAIEIIQEVMHPLILRLPEELDPQWLCFGPQCACALMGCLLTNAAWGHFLASQQCRTPNPHDQRGDCARMVQEERNSSNSWRLAQSGASGSVAGLIAI